MNATEELLPAMAWGPYVMAVASIILSSTAQILLKLLMRNQALTFSLLTKPLFYGGFLAYGVSALIWLRVLAKLPLVVAYPLVSLNFVLVAFGAALFLHERVSWQMVLGLVLIFSGIIVVSRS